jgi:3-hydroxyacyl-CoA dehydrogenase
LATADLVIEAITENLPLKQVIAVPVLKNFWPVDL